MVRCARRNDVPNHEIFNFPVKFRRDFTEKYTKFSFLNKINIKFIL